METLFRLLICGAYLTQIVVSFNATSPGEEDIVIDSEGMNGALYSAVFATPVFLSLYALGCRHRGEEDGQISDNNIQDSTEGEPSEFELQEIINFGPFRSFKDYSTSSNSSNNTPSENSSPVSELSTPPSPTTPTSFYNLKCSSLV
jgi:hypothetical protein